MPLSMSSPALGPTLSGVLDKGLIKHTETEFPMPIVNRAADLQPEIQAWRRDIHEHPELGYEERRTSAFVAERLKEFGCDEVVTGLGGTGVVARITGRKAAGKGD